MLDPEHPLAEVLDRDQRYHFRAYVFVFESLRYAQEVLGAGDAEEVELSEEDKHLTGQQLCEAIRQYALKEFGYLAKTVLNQWGVYTTSDFGEIVYNLIEAEQMRKTEQDRREDFDDVFDFEEGLLQSFEIAPDSSGERLA